MNRLFSIKNTCSLPGMLFNFMPFGYGTFSGPGSSVERASAFCGIALVWRPAHVSGGTGTYFDSMSRPLVGGCR